MNSKIITKICIAITIIGIIALAIYHLLFGGLEGSNNLVYYILGAIIVISLSVCILLDDK